MVGIPFAGPASAQQSAALADHLTSKQMHRESGRLLRAVVVLEDAFDVKGGAA